MVKTGRPKYRDGYKRVTYYLPSVARDYIKKQAAGEGKSASEYLLRLIAKDEAETQGVTHGVA